MVNFDPAVTLIQLKTWLRRQVDEGAICPVCDQHVQVYRRKLNSGMAQSLIRMYIAGGLDYIHLPTTIGSRSREEGKLRYWGLVEEENAVRPDGGRAGYWRVTRLGELFVNGQAKVYSHARVYNGRCLGLNGSLIGIKDALGAKFSYDELMQDALQVRVTVRAQARTPLVPQQRPAATVATPVAGRA